MQQTDKSVLERAIGYTFKNKNILQEALTHSSYANELKAKKKSASCNERLEFLGDAVLSSIVSEYLFTEYPEVPEGELTQRRKAVVQSSALASYAKSIDLGDFLYLGNGEEKGGGRERQSILENTFEALIAAMYLDAGESGKETVRKFLLPFIIKELSENIPELRYIESAAPHILSISMPGWRSEVLMNYLEAREVYVSKSSACKKGGRSIVLETMGLDPKVIDGAIRIGLSRYTTEEDAAALVSALAQARDSLAHR